jgi:hypothetical protein
MRVYAKCMTGMEDVWISRINDALRLQKLKKAQDPDDLWGAAGHQSASAHRAGLRSR